MAACQAFLSFTVFLSLHKLLSIELVMPFNHLILCYPVFCPQSFPASGSLPMSHALHHMAKILNLKLQHQSFQWILGLISFRLDWFDLFAVQGTLKSLLQHPSSKGSILLRSAFFMVQLSHLYMSTGKIIALTIRPLSAK